MKNINRVISRAVLMLLTVSITVLLLMLFMQIVLRYAFNSSFAAVDELGRFMFIWITLISLSVAFREKSHLGVTALVSRLKTKTRLYVEKIICIVNICLMAVLTYGGIQLSMMTMKKVYPTLGIPMGMVYLSMPVGAVLCILNEIEVLTKSYETSEEDVLCL